jgi:sulfonate transport system ATP-binding protein
MSSLATRVRGISKAYGTQLVLDRFDLDVARGERVAILGASGCGKSTLLRCIAGLERADTGTITTAGDVGLVFQEPRLFPWLDVEKNVAFGARTADERARVPGLLGLVGLAHAAKLLPKALSGGMAQRAALARALVRDPNVLLLDEPFAALDALRRIELRAAVREILSFARASAIIVTHDVDDALALADRVIVLAGSPAEIVFTGTIGTDATREAILAALGVAPAESERGDRFVRQEASIG